MVTFQLQDKTEEKAQTTPLMVIELVAISKVHEGTSPTINNNRQTLSFKAVPEVKVGVIHAVPVST